MSSNRVCGSGIVAIGLLAVTMFAGVVLLGFVTASSAQATIIESSRWHLGEAGSIVAGLPQDSVNTDGAYNNSLANGPNTVQTATPAPGGSTAYLQVNGGWPSGAWGTSPVQTFPTDNYGFEIWASASAFAATGNLAPVMTLSDAAGGYQISLTNTAPGHSWSAAREAVAWISLGESAPVALNTWYDLALVRAGGSTQFYVNGVAVGSPYALNQTTDGWVSFGMSPRFGLPTFVGDLDEARIFTFAPGQFSADDLYINQVTEVIPEPGTLAIWTLGLLGLAWYGRRRRK